MAKQISKSKILEDFNAQLAQSEAKFHVLTKAIQSADAVVESFKKNAGELKKSLSGIDVTNVKGLKDLNEIQKEAEKLARESIKATSSKISLEKQYEKLLSDREKRLKKEQADNEKIAKQEQANHARREKQYNKEIQDQIKLQKQREKEIETQKRISSAYYQESQALIEMRNRYKALFVQKEKGIKLTKEEEKEFRNLRVQIMEMDSMLKKADASAGQFQRNVGNYPKVLSGARNALSQLGLAFGAFQVGGFIGKTLVDFEENAANMAKTLGVSVDVAKNLSRELSNLDTRTSITDLQTIAAIGGQLGIEANQIVAFTESIDKLNVALGDEFTGGAEEVTSVLGGLRNVLTDIKSKDTSQDLLNIGNALNVLGAEGSATSPVIADFASRISGIGIPLGLTSDEVLGLSATLQELNVNSERGGTAVGAILQRITRDTKGFAQLAGMDVKKFEELLNTDLLGALKQVAKGFSSLQGDSVKQSKVLEQLSLTGSGASEVFLKLGSNIDLLEKRVKTTGEALKNTDSITQEFNVKNNTLGANIDKLTKEFGKYVLGLDESGKVSGAFATVLQFIIDNMQTILGVVKQGIKAWITYKAVMKALQLRDAYSDWKKLSGGIGDVVQGLKDGGSAGQKFGQALKGIGWTALISLISQVAQEVYDVASGAMLARVRLQELQKFTDKGIEAGSKIAEKYNAVLQKRMKQIDLMNVSEKEQNRLRKEAIENTANSIRDRLRELRITHADIDAKRKLAIAERDRLKEKFSFITASMDETIQLGKQENRVTKLTGTQKGYVEIIKALQAQLNSLGDETHSLNVEEMQLSINTDKSTKKINEKTKAYKDANDQIERMVSLIKETQDLTDEIALFEAEQDIQAAIESQLQAIEQSGQYSLELINQKIQAEYDLRKAIIERQFVEQVDSATNEQEVINARIRRDFELGKLDKEYLDKRKDVNKQLEDAQEAHAEKIQKSNEEIVKKTYENERKWIELSTKFLEDQIDKRIALLEKESEAHKTQQDYLRALAESGNIQAQQSLAEEARLQREADAEKTRLERQKQYIQVVSAFLTDYTNRLEAGESSTSALTGALADKAVLEALIASLPAFFEGTESTGKTNNPLDSNGGRLAILHDDERVLPKKMNDQLNGISNTELVALVQRGRIAEQIQSGNEGWKDLGMLSELNGLRSDVKELAKIMRNQPDRSHEIEEIVDGVLNFTIKEKRGNTLRTTKRQYRK